MTSSLPARRPRPPASAPPASASAGPAGAAEIGLDDLPRELVSKILAHNSPYERLCAAGVSRGLRRAAAASDAWRPHLAAAGAGDAQRWRQLAPAEGWARASGARIGHAAWRELPLPALPKFAQPECSALLLTACDLGLGTIRGELARLDIDGPATLVWQSQPHRGCVRALMAAGSAAQAPWVSLGCDGTFQISAWADGTVLRALGPLGAVRLWQMEVGGGHLVVADDRTGVLCTSLGEVPSRARWQPLGELADARGETRPLSLAAAAGRLAVGGRSGITLWTLPGGGAWGAGVLATAAPVEHLAWHQEQLIAAYAHAGRATIVIWHAASGAESGRSARPGAAPSGLQMLGGQALVALEDDSLWLRPLAPCPGPRGSAAAPAAPRGRPLRLSGRRGVGPAVAVLAIRGEAGTQLLSRDLWRPSDRLHVGDPLSPHAAIAGAADGDSLAIIEADVPGGCRPRLWRLAGCDASWPPTAP